MIFIYYMKALISLSEIENLKFNEYIPLECDQCGKHFVSTKRRYHVGVILRKRKNALSYCSHQCRNAANIKKVECICSQCGKHFHKVPSTILPKNFCSQSCSAIYNNTRRAKKIKPLKPMVVKMPIPIVECELCKQSFPRKILNTKNKSGKLFCSKSCRMRWYNINNPINIGGKIRSKFEFFMEEKIKKEFSHLDVLFNNRSTLGYELDVYIPQLGLAFEFNGPHHYDPIRGEEKLKKVQYKDAQKQLLCKEFNIKLITYDIRKVNGNDKTILNEWWENIKNDILCCKLSITQPKPHGGVTTFSV
jgi:hypothetical protein